MSIVQQACQGCCRGDEILCLSIPCPISIVLLGVDLELELPCLRLASASTLTPAQSARVLGGFTSIVSTLGRALQGAAGE